MLLINEITGAGQRYCPSIVNWMVERDMNQKFNHEVYGLKPTHRVLG